MTNYLILFDDSSLCNKRIDELQKTMNDSCDVINYDLEDDGIYSIIDELTTISLFEEPKFLIVKTFEAISKISENALNELLRAMNDVNSNNVLVFTAKKLESNEIINKVKRYCSTIDVKVKNVSLPEYAKKSLEDSGYKIDEQALSLLSSYVSSSVSALDMAIEILKCYKNDDKIITSEDVKLMIHQPLEDNVYQLVEAVINNDKKLVFKYYKDFKLMNIQPSYLVSLLINKFQELYNAYILVKAKYQQNALAELFNVSLGRAYYMIKNAKSSSMKKIKYNLELLNQLEYDIKSGKIDQSLGLELYLLK